MSDALNTVGNRYAGAVEETEGLGKRGAPIHRDEDTRNARLTVAALTFARCAIILALHAALLNLLAPCVQIVR